MLQTLPKVRTQGEQRWLEIEELLVDIATDIEWIRLLLYLRNKDAFNKDIRTNQQLKDILNGNS